MEISTLLKGHKYPSATANRCPRFHECIVSKKCQNYDRHNLECVVCESRTNISEIAPEQVPLGGYLPEGEYYPDMQDNIQELQKMINKSFAHPDQEPQQGNAVDIARDYERETKIVNTIQKFSNLGALQFEEEITNMLVDPETREYLGRLE